MTEEKTLLDIFDLLLEMLDEMREHNGKHRINEDMWCANCGEMIETEEHPTNTHKMPTVLS